MSFRLCVTFIYIFLFLFYFFTYLFAFSCCTGKQVLLYVDLTYSHSGSLLAVLMIKLFLLLGSTLCQLKFHCYVTVQIQTLVGHCGP
jgi:hypothetical protein